MMAGLTLLPYDPLLDLAPWVGQRQATFRFHRINGVTGENLGEIHPLRGAALTHDTTRTIKRQLTLALGKEDTAAINSITDRITVTMVFPNGQQYPLGKYMFTDASRQKYTSGKLGQMALNDEMFLVDQQSPNGVSGLTGATPRTVPIVVALVLEGLPIDFSMEPSPLQSVDSWSIGTSRGVMLEALATTGDYFSPWFDNNGVLRFIRSFNPATRIPEFDYDAGNQVTRSDIVETDDLLMAPNTFVVISNAATDSSVPVVGIATVPPTAPHSEANRGFQILETQDLQIATISQATLVAQNLANRQTIFERVTLTTAPDPRHDSYQVIRWQGDLWLELAWSMALTEGGQMNHLLRKAYASD
jgi:hypothetical protein